jgi:hypothetical protein
MEKKIVQENLDIGITCGVVFCVFINQLFQEEMLMESYHLCVGVIIYGY